MNKKVARKAAKWWADHLRNGARLDNGDDSETGAMTMMLATLLQKRPPSENINKFENELAKLFEQKDDSRFYSVGVDYGPDAIFHQAAEKAGLELGMSDLPWKTQMWVDNGKITYSLGYRGERQELS